MTPCSVCGAPLLWVRWELSGRETPLDAEPGPRGNLAVIGGKVRNYRPDDERLGHPRYSSHWATCIDAQQWRRPKASDA